MRGELRLSEMLGKKNKTSRFYSNPIRLTGIRSYTQERDKAREQRTKASSGENIFSFLLQKGGREMGKKEKTTSECTSQ